MASEILPLPLNKTVVEVFADFLAYLLKCASRYIQESHLDGTDLWASVKDQIDFVLPHPNGWGGTEHAQMREAAVLAKLIPDTTAGHARFLFVTEGEACLYFAMQNSLQIGAMKDGDEIIIVDAGQCTIDIGWYNKKIREGRDMFEEVAGPQSKLTFMNSTFHISSLPTGHLHGSVFVTMHAREFLRSMSFVFPDAYNTRRSLDRLQDSSFLQDLDDIVDCFDQTIKLKFQNLDEPHYIKFGRPRDNDENCNIRFGWLELLGSDVATFFEPLVECIVKAVLDQHKVAQKPISVRCLCFLRRYIS